MKTITLVLSVLMAILSYPANGAGETGTDCLSCHTRETPGVVGYWKLSAHAEKGVGCRNCHAEAYDEATHQAPAPGRRKPVEAAICVRCHEKAAREHFAGRHGVGFRSGIACTRNHPDAAAATCASCHQADTKTPFSETECAMFLAQSPQVRAEGCIACHKVENRCDSCHGSHDTSLDAARSPETCATCHMGPDHPQFEMWRTSRHGVLFTGKGRDYAPDCAACHMSGGSHNVSVGVTIGPGGQPYPDKRRDNERMAMLGICAGCHAKDFAGKNLGNGDEIRRQSDAMLSEAARIIESLNVDGLLMPSVAERKPHPVVGRALELGPQMLYENLSGVEAEFFRMKKFHAITAWKGVFHQSPDYAHWYGNAPLKLSLSQIASEAMQLRRIKRLEDRLDNLSKMPSTGSGDDPARGLRLLRERYLKGELSADEYENGKNELLKRLGL
ncbi:MAG: hypothetical protein HZA20_12455 [Nitrospirae bacterium]|nr:hypothetical protein [Nitrospirota bacterium]